MKNKFKKGGYAFFFNKNLNDNGNNFFKIEKIRIDKIKNSEIWSYDTVYNIKELNLLTKDEAKEIFLNYLNEK
jgi:hypothetical protein